MGVIELIIVAFSCFCLGILPGYFLGVRLSFKEKSKMVQDYKQEISEATEKAEKELYEKEKKLENMREEILAQYLENIPEPDNELEWN